MDLVIDGTRRRLQIRPINSAGMRANIVCHHRSTSSGVLSLNERFAMYLPDQRAYVIHTKVEYKEGEIIVKQLGDAPRDLVLFTWNPSSHVAPPDSFFQWVFKIPEDRTTRSIEWPVHRLVDGKRYNETEELALFNTATNAYLFISTEGPIGWAKE